MRVSQWGKKHGINMLPKQLVVPPQNSKPSVLDLTSEVVAMLIDLKQTLVYIHE